MASLRLVSSMQVTKNMASSCASTRRRVALREAKEWVALRRVADGYYHSTPMSHHMAWVKKPLIVVICQDEQGGVCVPDHRDICMDYVVNDDAQRYQSPQVMIQSREMHETAPTCSWNTTGGAVLVHNSTGGRAAAVIVVETITT